MTRSKEDLPEHLEQLMTIVAAAEKQGSVDIAEPELLPQSEPAEGPRVEATAPGEFCEKQERDSYRRSSLEEEEHGAGNASSIRTAKKLAGEVQAWCAGPRRRADEQIAELKELRKGLASTALGFSLQAPPCGGPLEDVLQEVSKRIEVLIKQDKAGQPALASPLATGKRKLFRRAESQPGPEHDFLNKKKAFLRGLHESFKRVRQRETVCMSLDKRLLSARLLLEQARRGCQSSDYVSMRSKRQVEQAYKELLQVQQDMDRIRSSGSLQASPSPEPKQHAILTTSAGVQCSLRSAAEEAMEAELSRQVEVNLQLKQQAERAESLLAVERAEVDRLRAQLHGVSGRLRQEARSLGECMRARQGSVDKLRCQVQQLEERDARLSSQLEAALRHKEELSAEKEELAWRLCGRDSELDKLRRENVSLVVEKLAMEDSSRSLQHKVDGLMAKLSQTKQQWSRFMVSTCELGLL